MFERARHFLQTTMRLIYLRDAQQTFTAQISPIPKGYHLGTCV